MSTPKPGQIRCPTCHESTPPGAFCTRCGQPIPASARARPRGLDRQELEDRLRGRRPGDSPYRRGAVLGDDAPAAFDRFEPEPEDSLAVRRPADASGAAPRPDHFVERQPDEGIAVAETEPQTADVEEPPPARRWPREAPHRSEPIPAPQPRYEPEPYQPEPQHEADARNDPEPAYVPPPMDEGYDEAYYDYGTDDYDQAPYYAEQRGGNGGPWLIVGIIGLGLVALLGGVLLSGLFNSGPGVARNTPTPTAAATPTATSAPEQSATPAPSSDATPGPPGTFPDGFTATVQPCASTEMSPDGCVDDGSTVAGDTVWVWAGFTKGTGSDVVGVTLVDPATDEEVQDASLELSQVNCGTVCNGYLKFSFSGLSAGDYVLRVTRNGSFAAEAPFTVS